MAEINPFDSNTYRSISSHALVIMFALSSPFHSCLPLSFQGVSSGLCPVFHRISSPSPYQRSRAE